MRLKVFIPSVLGTCLLSLVAALYLTFSWLLAERYQELEVKFAEKNLDRVENLFSASLFSFSDKLDGWSTWDDTFHYLKTRDPHFAERNLTYDSLSTLGTEHFILFDTNREIFEDIRVNKDTQSTEPVSPSHSEIFRRSPFSEQRAFGETYLSGLLNLGDTVVLAASRPVINNDASQAPVGMLLATRLIDQSFLSAVSDQSKLSLQFYLLSDRGSWPERLNNIFAQMTSRQQNRMTFEDGTDTLSAFGIVNDVYGAPALLVEITLKRVILYEGMKTRNLILSFTAVGVMLTLLTLIVILNKKLVRRLTNLKDQIWHIARSQKSAQRISLYGRDELGELASDINIMLTALDEAQHALLNAKVRAEELSEAKSQFLASVSHELRTPIHGILGLLRMLFRSGCDASAQSVLHLTYSTTQGLLETIDNLLDLSKIEAGKLTLASSNFEIRGIVREVLQVVAPRAYENAELDLLCSISPEVPKVVNGDFYRLRQILTNLLGNAVKFTPRGTVTLSLTARRESNQSSTLLLSCRDSGIGISPEELQKIFNPYEQADSTLAGKPVGTGLGLAIVRQTTEMLGGKLDVKSTVGQGTEFLLELPFSVVEWNSPPPAEEHLITCISSTPEFVSGVRTALAYFPCSIAGVGPDIFRQTIDLIGRSKCVVIDFAALKADATPFLLREAVLRNVKVFATVTPFQTITKDELHSMGISEVINKPLLPDDLFSLITESCPMTRLAATESPIASQINLPELRSLRILVADDNKTNRIILVNMLQEAGHLVEVAQDGIELLDLVERSPSFDLILTDVQMPRLDGLGATRKIREWERSGLLQGRLPIVALTAHAFAEEREKMLECGMDEVLTKPVQPARIRKLLEERFGGTLSHLEPSQPRGTPAQISLYSLDLEAVRSRVGGNQELFHAVLRFFQEDACESYTRVSIAWADKNLEQLLKATHSLKGVVLCTGCDSAVKLIEQLEEEGVSGPEGGKVLQELEIAIDELILDASRILEKPLEND